MGGGLCNDRLVRARAQKKAGVAEGKEAGQTTGVHVHKDVESQGLCPSSRIGCLHYHHLLGQHKSNAHAPPVSASSPSCQARPSGLVGCEAPAPPWPPLLPASSHATIDEQCSATTYRPGRPSPRCGQGRPTALGHTFVAPGGSAHHCGPGHPSAWLIYMTKVGPSSSPRLTEAPRLPSFSIRCLPRRLTRS